MNFQKIDNQFRSYYDEQSLYERIIKAAHYNDEKAIELIEKATELSDYNVLLDLAIVYNYGYCGVKINNEKAIDLFLKAIELLYKSPMNELD